MTGFPAKGKVRDAPFPFAVPMTPDRTVRRRAPEWPTLLLALAIYGGWLALTWFSGDLPVLVVALAGAWLVAWQGSLQHEVMHGHPTRVRAVNTAIGWPPLSLWLPYPVYRAQHLRHHRDELLTDPIEDPESAYLSGAAWARLGVVSRAVLRWNMTLVGRLAIGPFVMIGFFLHAEAKALLSGDGERGRIWFVHALGAAAVLTWVLAVCDMPLWLYLAGFVYGGGSLTRLRSFAEHRYAHRHEERTAIVENGGLLGLLYLNNNLHVLHHLRPGLAWYRLPALYRREREALVARNGGLVYRGYGDVVRRYFSRMHDDPLHPAKR